MLDPGMEARVTHIGLLEEITRASSVLDSIEEEVEEVAAKNRQIGYSCEAASKTNAQCNEIGKHLMEIDALIMEMTDALHEMDLKTLKLLKGSI